MTKIYIQITISQEADSTYFVGFFALLSTLGADSSLGQELRSKVRDQFRPIGAPVTNF